MTKTLLAGIAVLAVSVSAARADQPIGAYEVYDSNGNLIGQIASAYSVIATINDKVYQLDNIQRNEGSSFAYMFPNANFWYTNTTCSGQQRPAPVDVQYINATANTYCRIVLVRLRRLLPAI